MNERCNHDRKHCFIVKGITAFRCLDCDRTYMDLAIQVPGAVVSEIPSVESLDCVHTTLCKRPGEIPSYQCRDCSEVFAAMRVADNCCIVCTHSEKCHDRDDKVCLMDLCGCKHYQPK